MNLVPSRRVQELLRIVDTMHANAVGIYTEKKVLAKSLKKADEDGEKATDLITLLREHILHSFVFPLSHRPWDYRPHAVRANANASKEDALPEEELIAQLSYA